MCGGWSSSCDEKGAKGFRLYAPPEEEDDEAEIEAEMARRSCSISGRCPASLPG